MHLNEFCGQMYSGISHRIAAQPTGTRLACFLVLLVGLAGCGEEPDASMSTWVNALTDARFEGRETGTPGEHAAALWVDSVLTHLGLEPVGDSAAFQTFTYKPHPPLQVHGTDSAASLGMALVKEITGKNVLYRIPAPNPRSIGVIGAHYDHLGYGGENSLHRGAPEVHFGADDNASGVAVMLEVAARLKRKPVADEILVAAFSGEEKGLWGSNHFCEHPTVDLKSVKYMLNLDMVGRMRGDTLAVYGTGTSPGWMKLLESCNTDSLILIPSESGIGPSDHTSFYLEDIPVLHFFTGQHPDYHRPSDTADKLNYDGMQRIADFVERVMRALDGQTEWPFTATKEEMSDTPRFKVTLGVVPDYLYQDRGMRIDGVTADRPAARAGLQRGDIVVAIDTIRVDDMRGYMGALSKYEAGQTSEVTVLRGSASLHVRVTWD
jgi:hypothetical protein